MELTKDQIKQIANLARLELSEDELAQYGGQLSNILTYINQLQAVDTDGVEPTAQVTGLVNVFRHDEIDPCAQDECAAALNQAPIEPDKQIKVKRII